MEDNNTQMDTNKMNVPDQYSKKSVHTGPILGILIIVLVLILAGLYLWGSLLKSDKTMNDEPSIINNEPETPRAEADIDMFGTLSTSDDLSAIEADLSATKLETLVTDITALRNEVDGAYAD